jgi:phosphatidate cytidylyltransferase
VSDLFDRTLAGVAMMLVALACALLGGYYFAILVAALATAVFYEWSRMVRGWGMGWKVGGFFYALVPALAMLWIRDRSTDGLALILWVFIVTWATDIGAYFVGRALGRAKLAPSISPNKTLAGLYGGVAVATIAAGLWAHFAGLDPALFFFAPLFSLAAQAGDLFESWMKRRSGVKDSGSWLPGHGGLLDRLDGLVPVAILTAAAQSAALA